MNGAGTTYRPEYGKYLAAIEAYREWCESRDLNFRRQMRLAMVRQMRRGNRRPSSLAVQSPALRSR